MLPFGANRVLDCLPAFRQRRGQLAQQAGRRLAILSAALQDARDKRRVNLRRPRVRHCGHRLLERLGESIGVLTVGTARRQYIGACAQVADQRQLERARPCPQLTDGQGGDRLEGGQKTGEALRVEMAGTGANQLDRQRVDAGNAGEFVAGDCRQATKERWRQVAHDVASRR